MKKQISKKLCFTLLILFTLFLALPKSTFAAGKLPAVKNLKCGVTTANSINISWTPQYGISGYQIYRATSYDGTYQKIKTVSVGNNAFCNLKLQTGREYYYRVRAYKKQGGSTITGKFSKTLSAHTRCASRTASIRVRSNIRKHAGINHPVLATLNPGAKVTVICATSDKSGSAWSRISFPVGNKKSVGYIRTDLLTAGQAPKHTGIVTASGLRLRRTPSTTGRIIATLPKGTKVTIASQTTGTDGQKWYNISVKLNGKNLKGYAAARYIRVL